MATGKGKKRDFTQIAKAIIDKVTDNAPRNLEIPAILTL